MKLKPIKRSHGGDNYYFTGNIATVPGIWICGMPVKITMKEFNELRRK